MTCPLFAPLCRAWFRCATLFGVLALATTAIAQAPVLKILFLGDNGHHRPAERLRKFAPAMMNRGVQLVYTEDMSALTLDNLRRYDAILIYANIDAIAPAPEQALLDYVAQGGGLVALHCASYCFRNSERYVALVGAQFARHGTGTFRTRIAAPANPVLQGFTGFESWDETYVHTRHNDQNRTLLEVRESEPWTWLRTEGKGRVFYTAWGHDDRTWTNPGFIDLVERGIRYAAGQRLPEALSHRPAIPALELFDREGVPYYPPGQRSQGEGMWPKMQKPLPAAESMKRIVVPGGFELQLVASEPAIKKPIAMAWDERGRLWIAESLDYPNIVRERGQPGRDRIVICDDTNRDGQADRFTVFADGLNIPTSFTFSHGGVIVHQMPDTLFLKDTDGDDRADLREVLFTGWGRSDTHAGPSNLVYGHDNWIWGVVGYSGFNGSVGGEPLVFRQAFYRFRPDGSRLEAMRGTNNNTWGIGLTEEGVVFASTANNNPSVYLPIPNRHYPPAGLEARTLGTIADTARFLPVSDRVRQVDVHWGYTAAAGHAFYTARAYPRNYWNRVAFVTEPTGHLVGQFNVEASGADFRARNPTNLIASDDEWFAPIMAEVGPDGAVWVIDWYNYIVQHNPTPRGFQRGPGNAYDNPLRDQDYGRIYRIAWKGGDGAKPGQSMSLANATPARLVATLTNDNLLWRRHAQRLLVERARKDVVPALIALVRDRNIDEIGLNVGAIHALWTLHGLHAIEAEAATLAVATEALRHPSAGVRRTSLAVLPRTAAAAAAILEGRLLHDPDAQVRLAALLALSESPANPAAGAALHAWLATPDLAVDRWTVDAAKMTASVHQESFLAAASPAQLASARAIGQPGANVQRVDSFEQTINAPTGWELSPRDSGAELALANAGRDGGHSLRLAATTSTADVTATRTMPVARNRRYELAGWIKTENVTPAATALGAYLGVPQIQQPTRAVTIASNGTSDWSLARVTFETKGLETITVACGLGGGGGASGTAWFDDIVLTDLGPADDTVSNPLATVLAHGLRSTGGGRSPSAGSGAGPADNALVLELGVVPDVMRYDRTELTAAAGQRVKLVFKNSDHMPHNVLIIRPDTMDAVGRLADAMITDTTALAKNYVPASPDVLFNTPLVNPGETFTLEFTAPRRPGRYPYFCTFPGHWRIMQGALVITPAP